MRTTMFLLDLISNALGAMLMLYFIAVPRRFESLPVEVEDTLWIEASVTNAPDAAVDLRVVLPDGTKALCHPEPQSLPLTEAIPRGLPYRLAGHPPNQGKRCSLFLRRPDAGEYQFEAYAYFPGHSGQSGQFDLRLEGWLSGSSIPELNVQGLREHAVPLRVQWTLSPRDEQGASQ